ncbi:MAG: AbgT family transporter [Ignavibacteriales bacterium]|nr:AbgT family transporter [Ignavibacteriaceae bacterium]QOJ27981.1 MAG: AbgT family transporter [Ignavibacteriales bacterium]
MAESTTEKKSFLTRFLSFIERTGNALPNPVTLFAGIALLVIVLSWLVSLTGISVVHPGTGKEIHPVNLLSVEGLHRILVNMVTNFTNFAPLGTVLVSMIGIGILEGSGFIGTSLRLLVLSAPRNLITFIVVFAGVMSNTASEIGYVLLVPLSAIIFLSIGRHPIAGFAAAFAGVSGGYSANLLLGTIDPLLAGLTQEAAHIIDPTYQVNAAANYYFMAASTFLIAGAGTWVTEKIVIPRLGKYEGDAATEEIKALSPEEKKGLLYAALTSLAFVVIIAAGLIPENGFLRDPKTGDVLHSPFMSGIVAFIFLGGVAVGIAYGIGAKTFTSEKPIIKSMSKAMETLGGYIILVFFAAQFVAYFNWSNIGVIVAINGADFLKQSGLGDIPLMVSFIIISAMINLVMGSASAKWALMAPVFVPMFMLLGYSPELTQVTYRIGDSVTNIISPMMSYFALLIAFMERYDKKAGIGTLVATMLPYTVVFFIVWTLLLIIWISFGIPIGPGANLYMPQ